MDVGGIPQRHTKKSVNPSSGTNRTKVYRKLTSIRHPRRLSRFWWIFPTTPKTIRAQTRAGSRRRKWNGIPISYLFRSMSNPARKIQHRKSISFPLLLLLQSWLRDLASENRIGNYGSYSVENLIQSPNPKTEPSDMTWSTARDSQSGVCATCLA